MLKNEIEFMCSIELGVVYIETKIELSGPIESGEVCYENHT